jgi:hypothetical protein
MQIVPFYDGGDLGMQHRRMHRFLADPQLKPGAIMDEYVRFEKHHEAVDAILP